MRSAKITFLSFWGKRENVLEDYATTGVEKIIVHNSLFANIFRQL